jgi:hypothetical protein
MSNIPWTQPATLYSRIPLAGGRPHERALLSGGTLIDAVRHARSGSDGPLERLVIKIDDGSGEYGPDEIAWLASQRDLSVA